MAILQPSQTNVQYKLMSESLLHAEYLNIVFDTYLVTFLWIFRRILVTFYIIY